MFMEIVCGEVRRAFGHISRGKVDHGFGDIVHGRVSHGVRKNICGVRWEVVMYAVGGGW